MGKLKWVPAGKSRLERAGPAGKSRLEAQNRNMSRMEAWVVWITLRQRENCTD